MFALINPLTKYLKLKNVRIYDGIFILHSKLTVTILVGCSILISAKQFFGDPIDCISDFKPAAFVNGYCWTLGTYIVDKFDKQIGKEVVGVGIVGGYSRPQDRLYLRYYQWVVLILLLQALSFFLPAFLWKIWEGGRLQQLCEELGSVLVPENWDGKRKRMLVSYFSSDFSDVHMFYALKYFFCEFLNFVVCVLNILAMNVIFSGFWINYSSAIGAIRLYNWDKWNELSSRIFPKIAKCDINMYGSSGSTANLDALCLLPLNILNEKIFAFLWLWFLILVGISGLNLIYRIFLFVNCGFRHQLLRTKARFLTTAHVAKLLNNANLGDWFVLYRVSNNINPIIFQDLMHELLEVSRSSGIAV